MSNRKMELKYLTDIKEFWLLRDRYIIEDIIPNCNPPMSKEDTEWFLSMEYKSSMEKLFKREIDPLMVAYLYIDEIYAGFVEYAIYKSEDGKCFIVDFCIDRKFRGQGLGTEFFEFFKNAVQKHGAKYFALNTSNPSNRRFWLNNGFIECGDDEYGNRIYIRK